MPDVISGLAELADKLEVDAMLEGRMPKDYTFLGRNLFRCPICQAPRGGMCTFVAIPLPRTQHPARRALAILAHAD